jgi:hypothetical protein
MSRNKETSSLGDINFPTDKLLLLVSYKDAFPSFRLMVAFRTDESGRIAAGAKHSEMTEVGTDPVVVFIR